MLEAAIVLLLIFAFCVMAYKGAVHEFQILQKEWDSNIDWGSLLSEQLPLVIRNVDASWKGTWTRRAVGQKPWPIRVLKDGTPMRGTWSQWLDSPPGEPPIQNMTDLVEIVRPPVENWTDGGFRRITWIPVVKTHLGILGPSEQSIQTVQKTRASATVIQSTDGIPLEVWIAHEGAVPSSVSLQGRNPWSLHAKEFPWISEVKFVELKLRPGNALVLPAHWWWAARPQLPVVDPEPTMGDGAWYWWAEFHTPVSYLVAKFAQ
jgi:hypothetical protein